MQKLSLNFHCFHCNTKKSVLHLDTTSWKGKIFLKTPGYIILSSPSLQIQTSPDSLLKRLCDWHNKPQKGFLIIELIFENTIRKIKIAEKQSH